MVALIDTPAPGFAEVRGGTLIVASAYRAGEEDLLALSDALAPADVDELRWER